MSQPPVVENSRAADATLRSVVGKVALAIRKHLGTGEVAELRRISPQDPYTPALWKLLLTYVPEHWTAGPDRDKKERRWAGLFMGMALAAGLHDPGIPFGRALAEADWSELRFVRLMRDRDAGLMERVRRVARYLSAKSRAADWTAVAELLLYQDGERADSVRQHIARTYYRQRFRQEQKQSD
jgi:CRISPR system Cascade subunit CasB